MIKPVSQLIPLLQETDELVAILFTSIETAKKNRDKQGVFTWILELSVGYWMLKMGENGNSAVNPNRQNIGALKAKTF